MMPPYSKGVLTPAAGRSPAGAQRPARLRDRSPAASRVRSAHYHFVTNCIGSDSQSIRDLVDSEKDITLRTFREAIGVSQWKELLATLGYDRDLPISRDWHVGYYKGVYQGKPAVFLRHSAIEWIFVSGPSRLEIALGGSRRAGEWWR